MEKSTNRCVGPYAIPNVLIENSSLYTNTVPASSYRGFGCAQVTLPGESQIDELAAKIGKDPMSFAWPMRPSRAKSFSRHAPL